MNSAIRVKSNEEMLAEILPALTHAVRRAGTLNDEAVREELHLAECFGATLSQRIEACKAGLALAKADAAALLAGFPLFHAEPVDSVQEQ